MVESIVYREHDLTPRLCRRCHCVVVGTARKLSDRGVIYYEHLECSERPWPLMSECGEAWPADTMSRALDIAAAELCRNDNENDPDEVRDGLLTAAEMDTEKEVKRNA